jgi:glycosyltransferase involved in cell wall biosynthesis
MIETKSWMDECKLDADNKSASRVVEKHGVLMVSNFLLASVGTRGVCDDLALRLASAGWPVLTTSSRSNRAARLLDMLRTSWNRRHLFDVAQVDVFSGPAFLWSELVCLLLRQIGKPYILTLHGGNLPAFGRRWSWRLRRQLRLAAAVTTPSRYLFEAMRPYRRELKLLPNSLDVSAFQFRLRHDVSPRLVWLRKFHHLYNPSLAPRTVALLKDEFPELHLTMIGPDKGDGALAHTQRTSTELGLSARHISFQSTIPASQVPCELEKSDIFLNTTNFDNTPVSILEAMAGGMCIVSTEVGGIPFLLEDGYDSLLVPPDEPLAMARAIRRILTEPGLAQRLSFNARRKVEEFDWSKILPQWEDLLAGVYRLGSGSQTRSSWTKEN